MSYVTVEELFERHGTYTAIPYGTARKVQAGDIVFVMGEGDVMGEEVKVEEECWFVETRASSRLLPLDDAELFQRMIPVDELLPKRLRRNDGEVQAAVRVRCGDYVAASTCNIYPSNFDAPMDGVRLQLKDQSWTYWVAHRYDHFFGDGNAGSDDFRFVRDGEPVHFTVLEGNGVNVSVPNRIERMWVASGSVLILDDKAECGVRNTLPLAFARHYVPVRTVCH